MQQRVIFQRWVPDVDYAEFLFDRSRSFWPVSERRQQMGMDMFYHHCVISIELALKAYLAQAGMTPDYMAVCIRHNLDEAMDCAQGFGLRPPTSWNDVCDLLHPHFMNGGFQRVRRDWPANMELATHMVISGLLAEALYAIEMRKPATWKARAVYGLGLLIDDCRIWLAR